MGNIDLLKTNPEFLRLSNEEEHGILFVVCIYFIVNECFLVSFSEGELKNLKLLFAYWLAHGYLPV
jgi:hypothetical protein